MFQNYFRQNINMLHVDKTRELPNTQRGDVSCRRLKNVETPSDRCRIQSEIWKYISARKIAFYFVRKPIQRVKKKWLYWDNSRGYLPSGWCGSCRELTALFGPCLQPLRAEN